MTEDVQGYLLLNENYQYLGRNLWWYSAEVHDHAGWVWTPEEVDDILRLSEQDNWRYKPVFVQLAKWDAKTDSTIYLSEPFPI